MSIFLDLVRDLKRSKASKEKIQDFLRLYADKYFHLAIYNFVMGSYGNLMFRMEAEFSEETLPFLTRLNDLAGRVFEKEKFLLEENKIEALALRNDMRLATERATAYVSAFKNYKYALDRKYFPVEVSLPEDKDQYVRDLLGFLFSSKDTFVTNVRISEVMKCLPVRYTKEKFLDIVMKALDLYLGSDKLALRGLVYNINFATMTVLETESEFFSDYKTLHLKLKDLDVKILSKNEIETLRKKLQDKIGKLEHFIEESMLLIEEMNALYFVLSTINNDLWADISEERVCIGKIRKASEELEKFTEKTLASLDDNLNRFVYDMEALIEEVNEGEAALEILLTDSKELLEKEGYLDSAKMLNEFLLMRTNPFLDKEDMENYGLVEKEELDEIKENLKQKITQLFKEYKQPIRRAIMAEVLSELPISFENRTEVMDYIRTALSTCDNNEELKACLYSIDEIRRDDGNN